MGPSAQVPHIPLTPCADACRCNRRSLWRNTSTRALGIVSRRSLLRKAWRKACTKGSLQTSSAALAVLWSLSCTIVRRCTLACRRRDEVVVGTLRYLVFPKEAFVCCFGRSRFRAVYDPDFPKHVVLMQTRFNSWHVLVK